MNPTSHPDMLDSDASGKKLGIDFNPQPSSEFVDCELLICELFHFATRAAHEFAAGIIRVSARLKPKGCRVEFELRATWRFPGV